MKMHHCHHDDFRLERHLYETIGKPVQAIAPNTGAEELPSFRIFRDAAQTVTNFCGELRTKTS
jgi:hypothetical protein